MPGSYSRETAELDAEILQAVGAWHVRGRQLGDAEFDDLALRILAYQLRYNLPYARYCASLGVSGRSLPATWEAIPAVPAAAYKEATLCTFDPAAAALAFETSGTTSGTGGRHYMERRDLYDAALLAGFDRFMLPDAARLRYFNLVPNPHDRPESSLGYMMARVAADRGDGETGWYLRGNRLFADAFVADIDDAVEREQPACIAGTAFALVRLLDDLEQRDRVFRLPAGSRIMETGGFKGRTRFVERGEFYRRLAASFGISEDRVVAEYGMTELTSQYYDRNPGGPGGRVKAAAPWLRSRVVGPDGRRLPRGTVGALVHVDLANRSSCVAVATEDLGAEAGGGIVLLGRERGAQLRGCSLDAEALLAAGDGA